MSLISQDMEQCAGCAHLKIPRKGKFSCSLHNIRLDTHDEKPVKIIGCIGPLPDKVPKWEDLRRETQTRRG